MQQISLKAWMEAKRLTDADLARLLEGKISRSQVNRIRHGRRASVETARALEEVTKIPAERFVMGDAA